MQRMVGHFSAETESILAGETLFVEDHGISVQPPFSASNIAGRLIKSLSPYLDRCRLEHYAFESESNSSRFQLANNPSSKPTSLKGGIDPYTLEFCDFIVDRLQSAHSCELGTNTPNYEVSARFDICFSDIA
ncbi:hypothetical protein A9K71_09980 [Mesorhizobium sp. WSM3873]|nr:hypothetical protein A9K71_09980 [Mesorhizobium sp. WSM3873]